MTLFSFVVSPGYQSFISDQTIFVPLVYRALDPALFPNDLVWFEVMHTQRTLLTDFLLFFVGNGANMLWTLFALAVALRIILFVSLYFVIRFFAEKHTTALFILLFFVTPFFIPGTGHTTVESTFNYRPAAVATSFLFMALYLYGWRVFSLIPLLLGFTMHPITTMPFFMFYYAHTAWDFYKKREYHLLVPTVMPLLFVAAFLIWRDVDAGGSFFLTMDEMWKNLARGRNDPAFFAFWDRASYISLAAWAILGAVVLFNLKHMIPDKNQCVIILIILTVPIVSLLVAALGEYFALYGIIQLNLQRGLLFLSFFVPILFSIFAFWHAKQYPQALMKNWLLSTVILWFLFKPDFVFMREQFVFLATTLAVLFFDNQKTFATVILLLSLTIATYGAFAYSDMRSLGALILLLAGGFVAAQHRDEEVLIAKTVAAAPIALIVVSLVFVNQFTIHPYFHYDTAYREACYWIQENTAKSAVFIVEPFAFQGKEPSEFRLACFRPIFSTFEDGSPPYEPRDVSFEWHKRQTLAHAIPNDWSVIERIKDEYRVDYLFSEGALDMPAEYPEYPLAYSNERFFIYRLR